MRQKVLLAMALAMAPVLGAISDVANADPAFGTNHFLRVSKFEGHIVFCAPDSPPLSVEITPEGVQIITFANIGNKWVTGNPLVDGTEENIAVVTVDPSSPVVKVKITGKVDVAALDGIWKFRQRIVASAEGDSGRGFGLGTGDLRGKLLLFKTGTPELIENSPCDVPVGAPVTGKVISFGWIS